MATAEAFARMPEEVWRWYLFRRGVCRAAEPNAAHQALVAAERRLGDRFLLVTQNVDGLHLRGGQSPARTYQIHGNIDFCRCVDGCPSPVRPLPPALPEGWPSERPLADGERALLHCDCGAPLRPHVLWFDESYDEPLYRYQSALRAAEQAAALIVVGTSGATTLPARMCEIVAARAAPLIVVDPEPTVFSELAERSRRGRFLRGSATALARHWSSSSSQATFRGARAVRRDSTVGGVPEESSANDGGAGDVRPAAPLLRGPGAPWLRP